MLERIGKQSGIVKWYSRLKGYGFIKPDDGSREVFIHYSSADGSSFSLFEGDPVEYEVVDLGKGPQADSIESKRAISG